MLPATCSASVPPVLGTPGAERHTLASSGYASSSRRTAPSSRVRSSSSVERSMGQREYTRPLTGAITLRELCLRLEHAFDRASKEPCDPKGQRQVGIVPARLDRIDGLTRD